MKTVSQLLAKQQSKLFKAIYAPTHKTFIPNHIIADTAHPLHEAQKRRFREKKREGLWWHATSGVDLNKSSCVRAWARRRLREAVLAELRTRGYDENGVARGAKAVGSAHTAVTYGKLSDLKGSLRLHIQPPLISAQFAEVRDELRKIIDILCLATEQEAGAQVAAEETNKRPESKSTSQARAKWRAAAQR